MSKVRYTVLFSLTFLSLVAIHTGLNKIPFSLSFLMDMGFVNLASAIFRFSIMSIIFCVVFGVIHQMWCEYDDSIIEQTLNPTTINRNTLYSVHNFKKVKIEVRTDEFEFISQWHVTCTTNDRSVKIKFKYGPNDLDCNVVKIKPNTTKYFGVAIINEYLQIRVY